MADEVDRVMVEALMKLRDSMFEPMSEAVVGYRKHMESLGFSETASEMMAIEFHKALIVLVMNGLTDARRT